LCPSISSNCFLSTYVTYLSIYITVKNNSDDLSQL
jgi:hypothetical protein